MLLEAYGQRDYSLSHNENLRLEEDDISKDEELLDVNQDDPLSLRIPISKKGRNKLCKPWRRVLILKFFGEKVL